MGDPAKTMPLDSAGGEEEAAENRLMAAISNDEAGPSGADAEDSPENAALDAETDAMMLELATSQAEVQQMLLEQRLQNEELGGLKEGLTAELQGLQEQAWKLQMYSELEMLKKQLATLNQLETSLDAAEAVLAGTEEEEVEDGEGNAADDADGEEDALATTAAILERINQRAGGILRTGAGRPDAGGGLDQNAGAGDDGDGDGDDDVDYATNAAEIAQLQANLDAELAEMYEQLQAVKAQAATVAVRKAQLEAELDELLAQQAEEEQQEAGQAGAEEGADGLNLEGLQI